MEQIRLAKKRSKKRLKRKWEIQKRWHCHRNMDRCAVAHPYKKKPAPKIEKGPDHATYHSPVVQIKKTWREWFMEQVKILLRNMIGFISRGPKDPPTTRTSGGGGAS